MQERAREATIEHQRQRAVQEVQTLGGGTVDQEGAAEGSKQRQGQRDSARRLDRLAEAAFNTRI